MGQKRDNTLAAKSNESRPLLYNRGIIETHLGIIPVQEAYLRLVNIGNPANLTPWRWIINSSDPIEPKPSAAAAAAVSTAARLLAIKPRSIRPTPRECRCSQVSCPAGLVPTNSVFGQLSRMHGIWLKEWVLIETDASLAFAIIVTEGGGFIFSIYSIYDSDWWGDKLFYRVRRIKTIYKKWLRWKFVDSLSVWNPSALSNELFNFCTRQLGLDRLQACHDSFELILPIKINFLFHTNLKLNFEILQCC